MSIIQGFQFENKTEEQMASSCGNCGVEYCVQFGRGETTYPKIQFWILKRLETLDSIVILLPWGRIENGKKYKPGISLLMVRFS